MTKTDDKHDHELAAWLDGSDGVSAAYRQTAHEEPRPALDRAILQAARDAAQPKAPSRNTAQSHANASHNLARKPYALAASVMIAVAGLSFYIGVRDEPALQPGAAVERVIRLEAPAPAPAQQDATARQGPAQTQDAPAQDASAAAEESRVQQADAQRASANDAEAEAERTAVNNFEQRQLAPPAPTVGAGDAAVVIPPAEAPVRSETFARSEETPAIVIDGPLLEQIEAEAEAAQAQRPQQQLEEIMVTGSRIARPNNAPAYRASRDEWLAAMRALVADIERSTRLTVARRNTAALESQLEEEIDLFLQTYPDTDIDAELGLEE